MQYMPHRPRRRCRQSLISRIGQGQPETAWPHSSQTVIRAIYIYIAQLHELHHVCRPITTILEQSAISRVYQNETLGATHSVPVDGAFGFGRRFTPDIHRSTASIGQDLVDGIDTYTFVPRLFVGIVRTYVQYLLLPSAASESSASTGLQDPGSSVSSNAALSPNL